AVPHGHERAASTHRAAPFWALLAVFFSAGRGDGIRYTALAPASLRRGPAMRGGMGKGLAERTRKPASSSGGYISLERRPSATRILAVHSLKMPNSTAFNQPLSYASMLRSSIGMTNSSMD